MLNASIECLFQPVHLETKLLALSVPLIDDRCGFVQRVSGAFSLANKDDFLEGFLENLQGRIDLDGPDEPSMRSDGWHTY